MRPVNLIPGDQRRGGRGFGATSTGGLPVYGFLGALALVVLAVLGLVLTSNHVNDRKSTIAKLESDEASAKASADALRPYGNFAQLQRTRVETINSLVNTAFNWERVLRQLSRTLPSNAWLTSMTATVAPGIGTEGGGEGGSEFRSQTPYPAVELSGCTYSHSDVARMMTRMRNIDDVTEVALSASERPEEQQQSGDRGAAATDTGSGASAGSGDCRTRASITKFEILVVLGNAPAAQPAAPAGGSGSLTAIASAQGAVATSQQSAASTGAAP